MLNETLSYTYTTGNKLETEITIFPHSRKDNRKIVHTYNNQLLETERREYAQAPSDAFDQLLSVESWEYNERGQVVTHKNPHQLRVNNYNKDGKLKQTTGFGRDASVRHDPNPAKNDYDPQMRETFSYTKENQLKEQKRYDLVVGDGSEPTLTKRFGKKELPVSILESYQRSRPPEILLTEVKYTFWD